jgi:hypothetical protein
MGFSGLTSDEFGEPTAPAYLTPLLVADNVDLSLQANLIPRAGTQLAAGVTIPAEETFFNFGRTLTVVGQYVYATAILDEATPEELLYLYLGVNPRILWCTPEGTYVSVDSELTFLAGGDWPPSPETALVGKIHSINVAIMDGDQMGYVLAPTGCYSLTTNGKAERVDNGNYKIPEDMGDVVGVVIKGADGLQRVIFSEGALS